MKSVLHGIKQDPVKETWGKRIFTTKYYQGATQIPVWALPAIQQNWAPDHGDVTGGFLLGLHLLVHCRDRVGTATHRNKGGSYRVPFQFFPSAKLNKHQSWRFRATLSMGLWVASWRGTFSKGIYAPVHTRIQLACGPAWIWKLSGTMNAIHAFGGYLVQWMLPKPK